MTGGMILWVLLVMVLVPLQSNQQDREALPPSTCRGGFDFYFLIDSSSSVAVGNVFQTQIIPLVKNVTMLFVSPLWRVSYITFANEAILQLSLSSDRNQINETLENLKSIALNPGTFLALALDQVIGQLTSSDTTNTARASIILIITDGRLNDVSQAVSKANEVRRYGGTIFAIGVGRANRAELSKVANSSSSQQVLYASNAEQLSSFVGEILNYTCVEITAVWPEQVCIEQAPSTIRLIGRGLDNIVNSSAAFCRFKVDSVTKYDTPITGAIEYNALNCVLPSNRFTGSVMLEVSLNGLSVVFSNVVLNFSDCTENMTNNDEVTSPPTDNPTTASSNPTTDSTTSSPSESPTDAESPTTHPIDPTTPAQQSVSNKSNSVNFGIVAGVIAGILIVVVVITLFILWYCWLIIRKVQFVRNVKPPPEPEKEPPSPKKWPTVDASYYGGGGIGGIKQVQVHWGRRGSTEEGSKLTKSKDATELEVIEEESANPSKHHQVRKKNCCTAIKLKFSKLGQIISSCRPVRAEEGRIVWCPGPAFYADRIKLQRHTQHYSVMRSLSIDSTRSSTLRRNSDDSNCMKSPKSTQPLKKSSQIPTSSLQKPTSPPASTSQRPAPPPQRPAPPPQRSAPPPQRSAPAPQRPAPPPQRPAPPPQRPAPPPQRPAPPPQITAFPPQRPSAPPQKPAPPSQEKQRRLSAPAMTKPSVPPRPSVTRQFSANK